MTALIHASTSGKLEFCDLLLRYGANVNAKDCRGNTALMYCAANGHVEILKLLISYNADISARDRCRQPQHARHETS